MLGEDSRSQVRNVLVMVLMCVMFASLMYVMLVGKLTLGGCTYGSWFRVPQMDSRPGTRAPARGRLVVQVLRDFEDGTVRVSVRGQQVEVADLARVIHAVREETPDAWVTVRADRTLAYKDVSPVLTACADEDNGTVHLAVECW